MGWLQMTGILNKIRNEIPHIHQCLLRDTMGKSCNTSADLIQLRCIFSDFLIAVIEFVVSLLSFVWEVIYNKKKIAGWLEQNNYDQLDMCLGAINQVYFNILALLLLIGFAHTFGILWVCFRSLFMVEVNISYGKRNKIQNQWPSLNDWFLLEAKLPTY